MRYRTRCERCKLMIEIGQRASRMFGRLWHTNCALAYQADRRARRVPVP